MGENEQNYQFWRFLRDDLRTYGWNADHHPAEWSEDHLVVPHRFGVDHFRVEVRPMMTWLEYHLEHEDAGIKRRRFAKLWEKQDTIRSAFGAHLTLQAVHGPEVGLLETRPIPKGIGAPRHEWPRLRQQIIEELSQLRDALGAHVAPWKRLAASVR